MSKENHDKKSREEEMRKINFVEEMGYLCRGRSLGGLSSLVSAALLQTWAEHLPGKVGEILALM